MTYKKPANPEAAWELYLYADNTSELYSQKLAIIDNLRKKAIKGIYDHNKAVKLWGYWMESAARRYCREFKNDYSIFTPATRELAAKIAEESEWLEYKTNGWA